MLHILVDPHTEPLNHFKVLFVEKKFPGAFVVFELFLLNLVNFFSYEFWGTASKPSLDDYKVGMHGGFELFEEASEMLGDNATHS